MAKLALLVESPIQDWFEGVAITTLELDRELEDPFDLEFAATPFLLEQEAFRRMSPKASILKSSDAGKFRFELKVPPTLYYRLGMLESQCVNSDTSIKLI
jgi:hypothetical protein